MRARGWSVGPRRLMGAVLLGACLLLLAGKLLGQQREVIATAVPVTPSTAAAPAPLPPLMPAAPLPKPAAIQQVAYTETPPASATMPLRSPNELLSGVANHGPATPTSMPAAKTTAASLSVEVVGPEQLLLGQSLSYEIVVRNNGTQPAAEIHVEQTLPAGVRLLHSEPPATTQDKCLTWELNNLDGGAERRCKVEVRPSDAVELDLRPRVTFRPADGARTKVARPPFSVELSADHDKAARGEHVTFSIRVANNSETPIQNIKLYESLPSGLHHPRGRQISANFGDLVPHDTRTITLETTAVESGTHHNQVLAQADRGVEASAGLDVLITEPSVALRVDGPKQGVTRQDLEFHVEVNNPGPQPAKNVRLIQALPPAFEVVSASTGANLDTNLHALVWSLPDLNAGQRQTLTFRVQGGDAGDWPLYTAVLTDNLPEARLASVVHLEATTALKLEVRTRDSSLAVGVETTYVLHLFNHGDAACAGLQLSVTLPPELSPLDAQGPSAGKIEAQQVRFAPLAKLPARADTVYRVRVRGRQAGQGRVRVELAASKERPVQKELSIQVIGPATVSAANANSATGESLRAAK
jgi:uncharacterized repeat protein (TIGR01451 family)